MIKQPKALTRTVPSAKMTTTLETRSCSFLARQSSLCDRDKADTAQTRIPSRLPKTLAQSERVMSSLVSCSAPLVEA